MTSQGMMQDNAFVTVDTITQDKAKCQAAGEKRGEVWVQQPNILSTQVQCAAAFPPEDDETCKTDIAKMRAKAKKLGLQVTRKTPRQICNMVNAEEQRRCVYSKQTCAPGMEPDWPKNPTCCRPKSKGPQTKEAIARAEANIEVFVTKLAKFSGVWKMISPSDQKALIDETKFDASTKQEMRENLQEWNERAVDYEKTLPDMSAIEQRFVSNIVQQLKVELQTNLATLFAEANKKAEDGSGKKTLAEPDYGDDEYQMLLWSAQMTWEGVKYLGSWLPSIAKWSFNLIKWVMEHPATAMFITQLALQLKKRLCREMSLAFGYKGGQVTEGTLYDVIKDRSQKFYNENWEAVALATLHRWVEGFGFEKLVSKLGDGIRACFGAATAWLGVAGFFTGPVALVAAGFGWLVTTGLTEAFATSVHDTLLMTTTGLLMEKTGQNFIILLTGSCLQDQPQTVVWKRWQAEQQNYSQAQVEQTVKALHPHLTDTMAKDVAKATVNPDTAEAQANLAWYRPLMALGSLW